MLTKRFSLCFLLVVSASEWDKCVFVTWEWEHRTVDAQYLKADLLFLKWLKISAVSGCRSSRLISVLRTPGQSDTLKGRRLEFADVEVDQVLSKVQFLESLSSGWN